MEDLYKLKDMLCEELEKYGKKGDMSAGTLEIVDKLAHAIKNIDKIIEKYEEEEYSGAYYGDTYEGGQGGMNGRRGSYRGGSYRDDSYRSYARGRGRGAKRDSMGRYSSEGYSRHGDIVEDLRELMKDAPDEQSRMEIQKLVDKMEMR
jgi:hypothetical protein